jgi:glycosyltransferase involved in cell wall biosynthesis
VNKVILPDTSLCSIVRDEKMNPAGGIAKFVDSHVPYVEQAVIADTGSVDGTREILEEMQYKYSNLKVVDIPFRGYADARNKSLKYVQTKKALILDADELLTCKQPQNDWKILKKFIEHNPSRTYRFLFEVVSPERITRTTTEGHTLRLFDISVSEDPFMREVWELFYLPNNEKPVYVRDVALKHFVPSREDFMTKIKEWYGGNESNYYVHPEKQIENWQMIPPSKREGFAKWKRFNPRRENYI